MSKYFKNKEDESIRLCVPGSQEFSLKLSDTSEIEDTQDIISENGREKSNILETIIISDSSCNSDTEISHFPKYPHLGYFKNKNKIITKPSAYVLESSDSESDKEDVRCREIWKNNNKDKNHDYSHKSVNKAIVQDNNRLHISDKSSQSSRTSSNDDSRNHAFKMNDVRANKSNLKSITQNKRIKSRISSSSTPSSDRSSSNSSSYKENDSNHNRWKESQCKSFEKCKTLKSKLTRKDRYNIVKNIQATQIKYESPREKNKANIIIDETVSEDIHPALSLNSGLQVRNDKKNIGVVENGPLNNNVTQDCAAKLFQSDETCNDKSICMSTDINRRTHCTLSEQKRKDISQWLLKNSPDSKSDSTFSNIPETNRSSVGSGNSSLERLEMNYETPNNRERMLQMKMKEKQVHAQNSGNATHVTHTSRAVSKKYGSEDNANEYYTPNKPKSRSVLKENGPNDQSTLLKNNLLKDMNIMDCADILDHLYGSSWRDKANALITNTEPKKQPITRRDRAVQTEKKYKSKIKHHTKSVYSGEEEEEEEEEEEFNSVTKGTKKNFVSPRKIEFKNRKHRNSFIDDESLADSENEYTYYTALTNLGESVNNLRKPKPTPLSARNQTAIAICDPESDPGSDDNVIKDCDRKQLSFDEIESDSDSDTNTSEFDPGDYVPRKDKNKKSIPDVAKKKSNVIKSSKQCRTPLTFARKGTNHKSFLASLSETVPITDVHPDAKKYRSSFKNNKEELCKYLFNLYNKKIFEKKLPEDMEIQWNVRMRGTAGYCYNRKSLKALGGLTKSSRIVLATKILDTPDRLRDTLIHEMCHAAAWLINGVSDGHGPFWTAWATKAKNIFPELPPIRRCHDYKIKTKYTYKCTSCGYSIGRHSKSLDVQTKRCGHCYGKFELLINRNTKSGTMLMETPKKKPSSFALYVQKNYSSVKKERNMKHGDVMKLLGQQFSALKIAKNSCNEN